MTRLLRLAAAAVPGGAALLVTAGLGVDPHHLILAMLVAGPLWMAVLVRFIRSSWAENVIEAAPSTEDLPEPVAGPPVAAPSAPAIPQLSPTTVLVGEVLADDHDLAGREYRPLDDLIA